MPHQLFGGLRHSGGNFIPSGRQIPRTPPPAATHSEDFKPSSSDPDDSDQTRACDFSSLEAKTADDPIYMLKGMKGYQLTPGDLEFIKKMKEEQLVKKLEGDLKELQELIKMETMASEQASDSREKAEAELDTFPSCEQLSEWTKVVLRGMSPLTNFTDLDTKSLLAMVTIQDVQDVMHDKKTELGQMRKMLANKRTKEAEEREQLDKEMATKQLKIQTLMRELCDLKSELAQEEEACKLKTSEAQTTSVKTARGKQKKVKDPPEAAGATRARRKRVASTLTTASRRKDQHPSPASEPNNQTEVKVGEAESKSQQKAPKQSRKTSANGAGQETQNTGLRRSKRVANRRCI
ncbi:uncharacterized protein LOC110962371 isoform X2 [Acanthochromis polyacanthus]|uniref:uncharacterized protein LOC110962371 isoform X2 n=1 Tax=Acanthochromis polyacanthus TaxID=80966 RepID=UPI002234AF68|nr:uncharacterized protein LOC110962371 isoform X2 [Acanthochromis polyacanthus]